MLRIGFALVLSVLLISLGCNKTKEALLVGEWEQKSGPVFPNTRAVFDFKIDNSVSYLMFDSKNKDVKDTLVNISGHYRVINDTILNIVYEKPELEFEYVISHISTKEIVLSLIEKEGKAGDTYKFIRLN